MSRRGLCRLAWALGLALLPATPAAQSRPQSSAEADPRLAQPLSMQDCIAIALENNLELRIARLDQAATRTGVGAAYGAFSPVLTVVGERTNTHFYGEFPDKTEYIRNGHAGVSQLLPLGTQLALGFDSFHGRLDPDREDFPAHQWTFGVTQPLLRGGWWRSATAGVRGAKYGVRISDANLEGTRLGVVQQVKTAYYEVIRQARIMEVNGRAIERDSQLVRESQGKLDAGLGTKRDVLSAEIVLEQDRGKLVDASTAHQDALDNLARVLGLQVGARMVQIADRDVSVDSVPPQEAAWVEKAMRDNPTVRAARLAVERARLDMQVAGNGRLPQLDLSVNYTSLDDPDLNETLKDLNVLRVLEAKEPKDLKFTANRGWQALLTLSYPLVNKQLGSAYKQTRLIYQQSLGTLEDAERQVALDVRSAVRGLENSVERRAILRKNMEGARNKLEFATVNFQLGRASNMDITDAQKDLLDASTDYVNEIIDSRIQLANIEALIGGFE